jgi:glutamate 5-kinase
MIIAKGSHPDILLKLFAGEPHGTYFAPREKKLPRRKCWIAYTLTPKGTIVIDKGARRALVEGGKSLLPSGIVSVEGDFGVGAPVAFKTAGSQPLGIGLVNYSAADIRTIMGCKTDQIQASLGTKPYDEVIHRNNLVITADLESGDG